MSSNQQAMGRITWSRFARSIQNLVTSEVGGTAKGRFALLVALLFVINGLNVLNSYVGRDFMTAIADRQMGDFIRQAAIYLGVFALSTVAAVYYRYTEESLGLLWRGWLTQRLVHFYLAHRIYFHIDSSSIVANPDQRIAEDVRSYTVTTLSFMLMVLNGGFTVMAFSSVLWTISPLLFIIAILYAALGSLLTVLLGKRLVPLNYDQLDKEANFRADLIHVAQNAESVALLHREARLQSRLRSHLDGLVENLQRIIKVNRNVGLFTTGYNYLIQIIPALVVAPLYISGQAEFGVITQSAMAFTMLLGAFSLIVTQFQSISTYAAVGSRLSTLAEAIEEVAPDALKPTVGTSCGICLTPQRSRRETAAGGEILIQEDGDRLAFEHLSLSSPRDNTVLVRDLSLEIPAGTRVLVKGPSEPAKVAWFRAIAGIWNRGEGVILRPDLDHILFLPERPYLPPGTLRDLLLKPGQEAVVSDDRIRQCLGALDLGDLLERAGGLDEEHDWEDMFSLGEQQSLAFARLLLAEARFAVLDRPGTALSIMQTRAALKLLSEHSITYLTFGDGDDVLADYDLLVELDEDGNARMTRLQNPSALG